MTPDATAALAVLIVVIGLLALGAAAIGFGADSRPGIDDDDRRPWLVPSSRGPI